MSCRTRLGKTRLGSEVSERAVLDLTQLTENLNLDRTQAKGSNTKLEGNLFPIRIGEIL